MSIRFSDSVDGAGGFVGRDRAASTDASAMASSPASIARSPPRNSSGSRASSVRSIRSARAGPGAGSGGGGMFGSSPRASTRSMASATGTVNSTRSGSHRTLQFFRFIIGQRNPDYCSDAPIEVFPEGMTDADGAGDAVGAGSRGPSVRSILLPSNRTLDGAGGTGGGQNCCGDLWKRFCCFFCTWPAASRKHFILVILRSRMWRALILVLTFILLFGAPIQFTVIPPAGDPACDAVFMATFCIFCIDIFMRMDAEPNYFAFSLCGFPQNYLGYYDEDGNRIGDGGGSGNATNNATSPGNTSGTGNNNNNNDNVDSSLKSSGGAAADAKRRQGQGCCGIEIGSFLFWCDVVSTLTLLHQISFIDVKNFSEIDVYIMLDSFGVPFTGLDGVNMAAPVETEVDLFVNIAKTARMARFIRSSTAIKISSKVNWDSFLNIVNPCWWSRLCRRSLLPERDPGAPASSDDLRASGISNLAAADGISSRPTILRNSWSGVNVGMLAAVRAERAKKEKRKGLLAAPKRMLSYIGLLPADTDEMLRQVAAIKIQRAWRHTYKLSKEHMEQEDSDVAWQGRPSRANTNSENPVESALRKRSFLHRYSIMNAGTLKASTASAKRRNRLSRIPMGSSSAAKKRNESQVGSAMRELTGQRVAIGIILALTVTVLFTYTEENTTRPSTMAVLHNQTSHAAFANKSLWAARNSSVPDLYEYTLSNGQVQFYNIPELNGNASTLRPREIYRVTVNGTVDNVTVGLFAFREERRQEALVSIYSTFFILIVWFSGVTAFAGPVMVLVVIPIERMVRLLGMLMVDPLGYENSPRYKRFIEEEDSIAQNTRWTKEVLKGMETSFLMSTILRIGSLMKVGFGSAGVEIIRNHLEKGQNKNMLMLSSQGSSVSCIFLFCDIRQFTDATECLQEEVFVFTNRIAAVVHSYCHAYGGSANKNIGDAFLCSWLLDEESSDDAGRIGLSSGRSEESFSANSNQADKALLSVVKISIALHYDDFYIESLGPVAREALRSKLSNRKGPIVQMGFGLHAGKAVQGAIGSQRKIDATYVSEHVERSEFLESSTKQYGVKMLMSDSFHRLLHPSNRRRCRKIDQILIHDEEDCEDDYGNADGKIIELLTFDMDIDALWKSKGGKKEAQESDSEKGSEMGSKREVLRASGVMLKAARRMSALQNISDEFSEAFVLGTPNTPVDHENDNAPPQLVLPTGTCLYNANVWVSEDMRKIRQLYSDGLFFQTFNSGLQAFYARDWEHAKQCFVTILDRFEDGPSRYFFNQIEKNKGVPPRDFKGYGVA